MHSTAASDPPFSLGTLPTLQLLAEVDLSQLGGSGVAATGAPTNGLTGASLRAVTHRCPSRAQDQGLCMLSYSNIS